MSDTKMATGPTMTWVAVRDAGGRSQLQAVWTTGSAARGKHAA